VIPDPSRKWTPLEAIAKVPELGEPYFRPGKAYRYSNANFLLLGALVQDVMGKTYNEAIEENIVSKIGLDNTFLFGDPSCSYNNEIIHGYFTVNTKLYDGQEFDLSFATGAGGIISTTDDLIKYIRALTSGRLFKNKTTFGQMIERG